MWMRQEQVYGAFGDFHAYFAPLAAGRRGSTRQARVQSGERRNAPVVPCSGFSLILPDERL